ncbi:MAG: hypothetical protein Q8O55_04015, partial [Dehalococcoidales bacterium]|nr:hypothetical protein [Dehalococcoidales bacterium]
MVEAELRERITETIYTSKELNEQAYVRAWYAYKQTLRAIEQAWLTYEEAGQSAYKQVEEAC